MFSSVWILFFWSIMQKEKDQDDDDEADDLGHLSATFIAQQERYKSQHVQKIKCGSCASPLDQKPTPLFCPFCNASSDGFLVYHPSSGNWTRRTPSVTELPGARMTGR